MNFRGKIIVKNFRENASFGSRLDVEEQHMLSAGCSEELKFCMELQEVGKFKEFPGN